MKIFTILLSALMLSILPVMAHAQAMTNDVYTATVLDLNRINPAQNPSYDLGRHVLERRMLDKNLRTIGDVDDIALAPDGKFQSIVSTINTTGFREEVSFNVESYVVEPTPNTFTIAMDKNQIKESMPQLLSGIETAAGEEGPLMLSSFPGAPIYKSDRTMVAKVKDTLVSTDDNKLVALLITVTSGPNRGRTIAVPYEAALVAKTGATAELNVTDEQANIISTMATGR